MGVCKNWTVPALFPWCWLFLVDLAASKIRPFFTVEVFDLANSHTSLRVLGAGEVTIVESLPKSDIVKRSTFPSILYVAMMLKVQNI